MTRFIEQHALAFTPLTPIHVGCGEDFEPTNYVIDGGVLYHFDPLRLPLNDADRRALLQAAGRQGDEAIRAVQGFFYGKRAQCRDVARLRIPVAAGVAEWYAKRVGKVAQRESGGRTVSNQLEIERTVHHPHTGKPYLPGSSIKGSIRTAWLNHIDPSAVSKRAPDQPPAERSSDVEAELLGGSFATDPFRQVKVADAHGAAVASRVLFSVDRDKQQRLSRTGERIEKNLFVRREAIDGAQHRALAGEIRFDLLPGIHDATKTPREDKRIGGFAKLALACNRFYLPRLQADLALIRRRFADDPWVDGLQELLRELRPQLDTGTVMLLRVGRHSGAESVTLEKRRWIRILTGRERPPRWSRDASTIWLAAEREDSRAELLPFGWLIAEVLSEAPHEALRAWCERESARAMARDAAAHGAKATDSAEPEETTATVTTWDKARLRFNAKNGTLTATGPGNIDANALAPRGAELLASLPPELQRKVRNNEFVRVTAKVAGSDLLAVEAKV